MRRTTTLVGTALESKFLFVLLAYHCKWECKLFICYEEMVRFLLP